jgi:hypothetical protein
VLIGVPSPAVFQVFEQTARDRHRFQ